ncbi:unnamed protein product [Brassica oleracea]
MSCCANDFCFFFVLQESKCKGMRRSESVNKERVCFYFIFKNLESFKRGGSQERT